MNGIYRFSQFNIWHQMNPDCLILYNSLTGALTTFDESIEILITALNQNQPNLVPSSLLEAFIEDGYLIDDETNELSIIRLRSLLGRTQNELILSIMLTLRCNFSCPYCFQKRLNLDFNSTNEKRLIRFLKNTIPKKDKVSIDWYGGEPLLAVAKMRRLNDQIAELCAQHNTQYVISVTTNGFLLHQNVIEYLTRFSVSHLQITLDGPKETHDQSRLLQKGGPTFDKICRNIITAVNEGLPISVRVNVWKPNINRIIDLYDVFTSLGMQNRVTIILKPVISSLANPCEKECFSPTEAGKEILEVYRQAALRGWVSLPYSSALQGHEFCIVDSIGQFIIDPEGHLFKCGEVFSPEEQVGELTNNGDMVIDEKRWLPWVAKDPFADKFCQNCILLPICMGGCSMKRLWRNERGCVEFKDHLEDLLEVMVLSAQNEENLS